MRPGESLSSNPLAHARFTRLTDFEGSELDASISPDGKFVAFLSDREGVFDLWATQTESGEFFNLTKGQFSGLYQEEVRNIGFSGDGTHVWLLTGATGSAGVARISTQLVPILGGAPRPFLEKKLNPVWSPDGNAIAYHETTPGDPIFIADRTGSNPKMLFSEEPGLHCHYLTMSPDGRFIYFVRGIPPDEMDIWRISVKGGEPERITHHNSRVSYPALLNQRTLMYSAPGEDGSGLWLYSMDVERRIAQRASLGVEQYTSLSASADGRRLVATVSNPIGDLWTVPVSRSELEESEARRFTLPSTRAVAPQFGPDYILYLSSKGGANGLWSFQNGSARELWRAVEGGLTAAPAISPNGQEICFATQKQGRTGLYLMTADGTNVRPLAPSLDIRGTASWSPDGKWIATTGKAGRGYRVFKVAVDSGEPVQLVDKMSSSPVWSPNGRYIVYAEHQQGPTSLLKAVTPEKRPYSLPPLSVRREVDHARFLPNSESLIMLQGERRRQNFWLVDLATNKRRQLTNLKPGSSIKSFDISPDGKQILFDRVNENSDIVLIDLPQ
jgi:Tol biopolymer transport system component